MGFQRQITRWASALIAVFFAATASAQSIPWDWQLTGPFDLSADVEAINLDPVDHSKADIAALNTRGITTICYTSVGTIEDWRDDRGAFPETVIGRPYYEGADERFLDIRQIDVLVPLMAARFQRCKDMGFVAIDPDNQDIYENNPGMQISAADTVTYLKALAEVAHEMGLEIEQKNTPGLTPDLVGTMDFIVAEGCHFYDWCDGVQAYNDAGKPVYAVEIVDAETDLAAMCQFAAALNLRFIFKDEDMSAGLQFCP